MSERIHGLAHLLPGKTSLDDYSVDEIQQLTRRYPYFAPAQFLLLQKLKESGSPEVEAQQRKAVLYFHDPVQFEAFVSAEKFYMDESAVLNRTALNAGKPDRLTEQESDLDPVADESIFPVQKSTEQEGRLADEPEQADVQEGLAQQDEEALPATDEDGETPIRDEPMTGSFSLTEESESDDSADETPATDETEPAVDSGTTTGAIPVTAEEQTAGELTAEGNVTNERDNPSKAIPSATGMSPQQGEALTFEPYHAVDYFASQGIKIMTDELPKDRLGKQMRSFTEWLKTMKRLPATEMAKRPESTAEKNVETMASHSVEQSDVVTEAMAEVWAKQGATEKAREIYNKLSLLNPSKKAYFAAKIENLSGS
ncbi:hypothetical protein [Flavisolibacter nicotianae]|uniref:hypothetical protein n=1 Tax=Flavisolibacter nicotianae TaxID=2364882 RepID=UPI0013C44EE2|nr:hypothetical protein [Flavisolibacter nicotianae]